MIVLFFLLAVGQSVNIYKMIRLFTQNARESRIPESNRDNMLMNLMKNQHNEIVQQEILLRLLGIFLSFGVIWGWIDIIRYFTRKHEK